MNNQEQKWTILVPYRETKTEVETLPLDEENLVVGLQSLSVGAVVPIFSETDGRKLRYHFDKIECLTQYRRLQMALAGALPEGDPLLMDFCKELLARQGWRNSLAMMRNVNVSKYVH